MTTSDLFESQSAVASSNKASVRIGPKRSFEDWTIERMTVTSDSSTLIPTLKVYRGQEVNARLIDGTFTGTLDHSDTMLRVRNGEELLFVWTNCDNGAECSVILEGKAVRE